MKLQILVIAAFCVVLMGFQEPQKGPAQLKSQKDSVSYSIGLDIGKNLKTQGLDIDPDILARAIKDFYSGNEVKLTDSQSEAITAAFRRRMRIKHTDDLKLQGEKNKKDGEAFLAANAGRDSVTTLPSGLQYKVLKMGTGPKPALTQRVVVSYRGTLLDGSKFDDSYERGHPDTFSVKGVIRGWTEALQLMPAGSTWMLYVPSDLAYGERGAGRSIPPNSTLIFEIELLEVR